MSSALTHRSTKVVRLAYAALFAGSLVAAISVAGAGTWQIWAFLIGPDLALLLGIAPGLEKGQLHPRAVPVYNALHRLGGPFLLGLASIWLGPAWLAGALAWAAHVFMDRAFGYDLRTPEGFVRGR
jgi:Domain of unknown function (DUF4260)